MNQGEIEDLLKYMKSIAVSLKGIREELTEIKENLETEELDEDLDEEVDEEPEEVEEDGTKKV